MDINFSIVRADSTNADFVLLVSLLDKELEGRYGEEQKFFAQFNTIEKLKHVVILYANGKPAGCGAFRKYDRHRAEIKRMYVVPEWRGQRLGERIIAALEHWASETFSALILETGVKQPDAIRLYERCGYTRIPNFPPYENVTWSICMQKNLS